MGTSSSVILAISVVVSLLFISVSAYAEDSFIMQVELKDKNNQLNETDYEVASVNITKSNGICPSMNCDFDISGGELRENSLRSEDLVFEGTLKAQTQNNDTKITKLYPFHSDISITEIRESKGLALNLLEGKIGFGKDNYNPDFEYDITNGTLTVQGPKATLVLSGNSTGY